MRGVSKTALLMAALVACGIAGAEPGACETQPAQTRNKVDTNLLRRYPNVETHNLARRAALETPRNAVSEAQKRLHELDPGGPAAAAQREVIKRAQAESDRISAKFDAELKRLRELWDGSAIGRLTPQQKTPPHLSSIDDAIVKRPPDRWNFR